MKIMVTGSSGTIGTRLCEKLLDEGHEVVPVDWEQHRWVPALEKTMIRMDLRDRAKVMTLPKTIDVIVHLAANARVYELVEHPDRAFDNMITTFNVLEFARNAGIKKIVFASSRETYGNIEADNLTEDMARIENCESPYTASKIAGEALVESYARCYGIDHVTIRFSNVYGMYDDSVRVVPLFIRLARKNEALTVFGKEKCLDFTYIDDAVAGVMLILEKFDAIKGEVINLAYGEGTTILHLAQHVKDLLKSSSEIRMGTPRTGEVIRYVADITKAKKLLGFAPKTDLDEGIEKAVAWYCERT